MSPLPASKLEDLGEMNMGDGEVLRKFVSWGMDSFLADHTMLIIWDHGQGWRISPQTISSLERSAIYNPYKSVSHDSTDHNELYNRDSGRTRSLLKSKKLDILGFDACLMEMAETGYAFRDLAGIMIASEDWNLVTDGHITTGWPLW